ncbi:MAG: DUF1501 domain-containing protein [Gemmataceae bacterium]|nr:DUF1501 domain-containing protein [Gemmataceae bacterium]
MLTIFGKPHARGGYCDGHSRRDFLTVGGTLVGSALALPNLLAAGASSPHKAIINVYLPGGPPHQDMWDLKPDAPADIRGEFDPIATSVPGIRICEHFPRLARMAERLVFIRSLVGSTGDHDGFQCMTGHKRTPATSGYWPSMGAWVSKVQGPASKSVPPHVTLMYPTGERRWGDPGTGGFLGMGHSPFRVVGNKPGTMPESMALKNLTLEKLGDRVALSQAFDGVKRSIDKTGAMDGMDDFSKQAMGVLTSSKLVDALDLGKEPKRNLEKYGVDDPAFERDGAPRMVRNFCLARRLVEAGARVVTMNFTRWDWHGPDGKNFVQGKKDMPLLDRGLAALLDDLHAKGMQDDVSIVVWGEFGRTPRINKEAGRDHWPQLSCALLAGGGMRTGQVIGSSDKHAGTAKTRPVTHQEIFATLYQNIGFDLARVKEIDPTGRPQFPIDAEARPLREVA